MKKERMKDVLNWGEEYVGQPDEVTEDLLDLVILFLEEEEVKDDEQARMMIRKNVVQGKIEQWVKRVQSSGGGPTGPENTRMEPEDKK